MKVNTYDPYNLVAVETLSQAVYGKLVKNRLKTKRLKKGFLESFYLVST
jgi:hypothetical protein